MSLTGSIDEIELQDVFQVLLMSAKSGLLTIENGEQQGQVVFVEGKVASAWATDSPRILAEVVGQSEASLSMEEQRAPIPRIVQFFQRMPLSSKTPEELPLEFTKRVVVHLLCWNCGRYQFDSRNLPPDWILLDDGLDPTMLLLESAKRRDETSRDSKH
jgi:hypothetical protein